MAFSALEDGARGQAQRRRGCEHYDRGCLLKAPCCDKLYTCRLCHDNNEDHQLDRFKVKEVQCINCERIQRAQQTCEECSTLFGEYYCSVCHLFDKDKKQYHCEHCGICRIGPKEDFFHCLKCNLCLAVNLQGKHKCIENVSRQNCPICLEDIHTSRIAAQVLPCGHLLHRTCYEDMLKEGYRCPLCMRSALDMSRSWRQRDDEVAQTPMPSEYQNMTVDEDFPGDPVVKTLPSGAWGHEESDTTERLHFHFSFHALEKEMATHSSTLAWKIPWMEEPGGLPSMGSHRIGHD
ncbi:RING finger and CHY zinc finger domain-containing protein 1 isoform X1 [Bubalus kerabau]|uniref:RING finger and CHY zinc finger domain-containing protein 1 isoform X1 n=1 Tax=Bubalus carabanensis TaxID=3119969 RepID=UPI00244EC47C|nr:RING finger and CHY zinc finger domain-containing protein 1 isoform X1 [Bubalus carabanensis]